MSSKGSIKVVVIALGTNLGIALAKFAGALFTGSASLMAESIHSVVDCSNQGLLLYGAKKSLIPHSSKYPLGRGRESFFWSFMVALLLFSLGGLFAIFEGLHKLKEPEPMTSPLIAMTILGFSAFFEFLSFRACLKEIKAEYPNMPLLKWFKQTTSSDLIVIFTEDLAALLGLLVAFGFLVLALLTDDPKWDALGSIAVGTILVVVAVFLAAEIKSLLIGEAPSSDYQPSIEKLLSTHLPESKLLRMLALQIGSQEVMLSIKISEGSTHLVKDFIGKCNAFEKALKGAHPEIKWSFVEVDDQS